MFNYENRQDKETLARNLQTITGIPLEVNGEGRIVSMEPVAIERDPLLTRVARRAQMPLVCSYGEHMFPRGLVANGRAIRIGELAPALRYLSPQESDELLGPRYSPEAMDEAVRVIAEMASEESERIARLEALKEELEVKTGVGFSWDDGHKILLARAMNSEGHDISEDLQRRGIIKPRDEEIFILSDEITPFSEVVVYDLDEEGLRAEPYPANRIAPEAYSRINRRQVAAVQVAEELGALTGITFRRDGEDLVSEPFLPDERARLDEYGNGLEFVVNDDGHGHLMARIAQAEIMEFSAREIHDCIPERRTVAHDLTALTGINFYREQGSFVIDHVEPIVSVPFPPGERAQVEALQREGLAFRIDEEHGNLIARLVQATPKAILALHEQRSALDQAARDLALLTDVRFLFKNRGIISDPFSADERAEVDALAERNPGLGLIIEDNGADQFVARVDPANITQEITEELRPQLAAAQIALDLRKITGVRFRLVDGEFVSDPYSRADGENVRGLYRRGLRTLTIAPEDSGSGKLVARVEQADLTEELARELHAYADQTRPGPGATRA